MIGLTEDDKETLRDMVESGQWQTVLKLAEKAVRNLEIRLVNASADEGRDEIWTRKAQLEGGKTVKAMFESVQTELRGRKK